MTRTYLQRAGMACAAALAFGALAQSAAAQSSSPAMKAVRNHCSADFVKHCARVRPGGREALACLEQQIEKLSQSCQDALFAIMPPPTRVTDVPAPAGQQHASAPPPAAAAGRPAARTLAAHRRERAAAAPRVPPLRRRATAARARAAAAAGAGRAPPPSRRRPPHPSAAEQRALRKYCRKDYFANCPGIPAGQPRHARLPAGQSPHLSRACRRVVSAIAPQQRAPDRVGAAAARRAGSAARARRAEAAAAAADAVPPAARRAQPGATTATASAAAAAGRARARRCAPPPPTRRRAIAMTGRCVADRGADAPRRRRARAGQPPPAPVETSASRAYCGRDFAALCPSLRPGSGAAIACLKRRAIVLTAALPAGGARNHVGPAGRSARQRRAWRTRERAAPPPPRSTAAARLPAAERGRAGAGLPVGPLPALPPRAARRRARNRVPGHAPALAEPPLPHGPAHETLR